MQRFAGGAGIGNKRPPSPGAGGTSKIANIAGTPTWAGAKASKNAPSTGSPFLDCVPGTRVIYSRRVEGRDGSPRMALFKAKVVKTAGDRVDDDQHQIKLDEDGTAWWEPTMNVYDIVVPPCTATGPPCDGIRRMHFVEGSSCLRTGTTCLT